MRIGIDANEANLTTNRVGVNQYAFYLLHALYNNPGPHTYCIYLKSPLLPDMPPSRKNWEYRIIPFPKLWTQTRLPFDLYTHRPRPDVFFSMTHYAPRWCPVPSVISIMDLGYLDSPEQFSKKDFNQLKMWTEYSIKQATKVITISDFAKQTIIDKYSKPEKDITVTLLGYDDSRFYPHKDENVLKKYGVKQPYIFFLSSLKPSKNLMGLVEAFSKISPKYPKMSLVIAGKKAWLYEKIFDRVRSLGLESKVIFTGFVGEDEAPILMSMSEVFALPSFYEGFGIPALEAMACGVPVVVSKVASLPEVVGNTGIFVDPYDTSSIATGLSEALGANRQKYIRNGLARVKLFNWRKTAAETLICLQTATEKN